MGRRRSKKGGGWFSEDVDGPGPFGALKNLFNANASPTAPVDTVVDEGTKPLMTAGRRIKKHVGFDPTSSKDAQKVLKTAKGDRMLGKRRRKTRRRR
jgi:hypothetical protein